MSASEVTHADPFGLDALRAATLDAWRSSPTRLREDLATEHDLTTVGYRDRVCTELVANAADAATAGRVAGEVAVWADGDRLHVANTGAPLTAAGVESLTAMRVSAKSDPGQVGRFGVGFNATAAVADRIEIRSGTGSMVFDKAKTADAVREAGIDADDVPVLRLAWPTDARPADGHATEVVLHLRDGISASGLLADLDRQAPDLLLELPALQSMWVGESRFVAIREVLSDESATDALVHDALVSDALVTGEVARRTHIRITRTGTPEPADRTHTWWEAAESGTRWAVEIGENGPLIAGRDVLRAPTPTDIELTLPARCITDLPLTADRRRLHPSADIDQVAQGYSDLVGMLEARWRPLLVPGDGLTVGPEDARLTQAVLDALRDRAWVPAADGGDLNPDRAVLIADLTDDLAAVLGPVMADLVHPSVSGPRHRARLRRVGVVEIGWAALAERLTGVAREPQWWHGLYAALSPLITSAADADELGAMPVPRSDGRMSIGARGLSVIAGAHVAPSWIPTIDADALHPLLERLGAERVSVAQTLDDPVLRARIESADDLDDDELLRLAREVASVVVADSDAAVPDWLRTILLPDADGDFSPADELLLPGSPIADVLVDDSPFGRVDAGFVEEVGVDVVRRMGAGWGFLLLREELPVGPDHDLDDEERWWDSLTEPPETLTAVRDLDLVDDDRWPAALTLLLDDEEIARSLTDRAGYTAWWLRHHAVIDGRPLGWYRAPSDATFAGLLDPLDHPHADDLAAALAGPRIESAVDAANLLEHLADPGRDVGAGVVVRAYAALVDAVRGGRLDPSDSVVPQRVRTVDGGVHADAMVVDRPWLVPVLPPDRMVLAGFSAQESSAAVLADLLDLPLATDVIDAEVVGAGVAFTADSVDAVLFSAASGIEIVGPLVRVHDDLVVEVRTAHGPTAEHHVDWWVDDRGITHLRRRG